MARKTKNLAVDGDVVDWIGFGAYFYGESENAFINRCIRDSMEGAPEEMRSAFLASQKARGKGNATGE